VLVEVCFFVLRNLPLGNIAFFAALEIPFIPQPAGGTAPLGMSNHKCLITVSGNLSIRSLDSEVFNPVEKTAAGGPQFDLLDQNEKINLLTDVFIFDPFSSHLTFLSSISRLLQT
jgi:hypothetical protein